MKPKGASPWFCKCFLADSLEPSLQRNLTPMSSASRRDLFKAALGGAALVRFPLYALAAPEADLKPAQDSSYGIEGQRKADLSDGTYLNPIVSGDHPDPTVLKDGADYYMTFSSFYSYPGAVIWHSRDLVNWTPIGPALHQPIGSVWAMDLVKHNGRYFLYIPSNPNGKQAIFVIHADDIRGPWSDPIDLKIDGCIDPGHVVGEDGKRYLFLNGVRRIALADDGLSTVGPLQKVYEPWRYPVDWVVEEFAPEGTKSLPPRRLVLSRRGRRRHGRSADKSHGHGCSIEIHPWSLGKLPP